MQAYTVLCLNVKMGTAAACVYLWFQINMAAVKKVY